MKLKIITHPNPILKQVSKDVVSITDEIRTLVANMVETVEDHPTGIGLAAIQVGVPLNLFIMKRNLGNWWTVVINPRIIARMGKGAGVESCLSLPNEKYRIRRSKEIVASYTGLDGKLVIRDRLVGLNAIMFLHEYSHLRGKLIRDEGKRVDKE